MNKSGIIKHILIALGWMSVVLGIIGAFLPLLPSTVFFILAAWCFSKSSDKFHNWLLNHPVWGKQLRNFLENRGMSINSKIISIVILLSTIALSIYFFAHNPLLIIFLLTVAVGVSGYILSLNTIRSPIE